MKQITNIGLALFAFLLVSACVEQSSKALLSGEIAAVKNEFAPDKRVALFNISAVKKGDAVVLKGESNLAEAVDALKQKLTSENIAFVDSVQLLPAASLENKTNAVINISVANLRSQPKHSAELATQATLGTPVKVLKEQGEWYYIQTPDNYLSWVDAGGITRMDDNRFRQWKKSDKIIYTKTYGHAYNGVTEEEVISDLVAGDVLEFVKLMEDYFVGAFPDGRIALIRTGEAKSYFGWIKEMNTSKEDLVTTSKTLVGVPYLWGGTSTKGVDCSGFTKTVYFLNGMVIPRDASQQVHTGKLIDAEGNFDNIEEGDLLFFGKKATSTTKEKVVHVGMWIGNNEYIHASNLVRISSVDPNADSFDEYNFNRYLRTKRILKQEDKALIDLTKTTLFKN